MFHGRILLVSSRDEVIAELEPIIRAEGHLTLSVPSGDEALSVFEEGIIPDVVVSDARLCGDARPPRYLQRFQRLNQLGQHLIIADAGEEAPASTDARRARACGDAEIPLHMPFETGAVRAAVGEAMARIGRDLKALRAEMFRETDRLQKAIREAQLEMVTALALTMEAKDPYMRGHCERVAEMARRVAEEMGLDEVEIERLGTAAMLHEIGKIGVPLEMLHHSGPLTPNELKQVRAHPVVGAQIVAAVPSLRRIAPLIETQYVDYAELAEHLSPETPEFVLACILRVADTYDAMTSERAYREGLPRERWEHELRSGSGSRYHADVLDAFFRVERQTALQAAD
jgi:HD-GYP domain-containing protein (c-di-GMP phosphodiesterase class II)